MLVAVKVYTECMRANDRRESAQLPWAHPMNDDTVN